MASLGIRVAFIYVVVGVLIAPLSARAAARGIDFYYNQFVSQKSALSAVHAIVQESIDVPPNSAFSPSGRSQAYYDWSVAGDSDEYSYMSPSTSLQEVQIDTPDTSYDMLFSPKTSHGGQCHTMRRRGTIIMPLDFAYMLDGKWLADEFRNWKWQSPVAGTDPVYGPVVLLTGTKTIESGSNSQTNQETLTLSANNRYVIVENQERFNIAGNYANPYLLMLRVTKLTNIRDIPFPTQMREVVYRTLDPNGPVNETRNLSATHISFNTVSPATFRPKWREAMLVTDGDSGYVYQVRNGKLVRDPGFDKKFTRESAFGLGFILSFIAAGACLVAYLRQRISSKTQTQPPSP